MLDVCVAGCVTCQSCQTRQVDHLGQELRICRACETFGQNIIRFLRKMKDPLTFYMLLYAIKKLMRFLTGAQW